ncbi:hypothetical protein Mapa_015565 [Marchantia paleacea]|nr:hypothetical protein Mapa_015565 [Marchantia paleacea]
MEAVAVTRTPVLELCQHSRCVAALLKSPLSADSIARVSRLGFRNAQVRSSEFHRSSLRNAVPRLEQRKFNSTVHSSHGDAGVVTQEKPKEVVFPQGDSWAVHKFGGTCVGNTERISNVAGIIVDDPSLRKAVVVSAMSKVTDLMYDVLDKAQSRDDSYTTALDLIEEKHRSTASALLGEGEDLEKFLKNLEDDVLNLKAMLRAIYIAGHANENFSDYVAGHGELWSAQMLAAAVRKKGQSCVWMDARKVLVVKPTSSNQVDPDFEASLAKLVDWYAETPADCIIVTGFIASTPDGIPTTLKRDGSDFSAAIMGALFRADQVTIWTDVDGVYSADPRKVKDAVVLSQLSYQEAWEMSYFGANVLHPRTTIPVMKYNIPITIRNVFNVSAPGTRIWCSPLTSDTCPFEDDETDGADKVVKGFATIDHMALVNVEGTGMAGVPGTASAIFETVKDVGANVVMISQASSEHSVCFAVPEKEVTAVAEALERRFKTALKAGRLSKVEVVKSCAILAAVGQRMASTPGVSATLFNALAKANINVRAIAQGCSEYNITVVVNQEDSIRALKAVHSRFYLSKTPLAVGIIGPGLIGATLLDQLRDQSATLKEEFNIDLRIMGILGSKTMVLDESRLDLQDWRSILKERGVATDVSKFTAHLHQNHFVPNKVIVDCTANAVIAEHYLEWLKKGIHIITPNKKANSGPLDQYLAVKRIQRQSYTHYFYEATVGAGLPIMSTLRGLLETGDKIQEVQGIFSGTLSYIFNNLVGDRTFSDVVKEAKAKGFTEPDPRDDLSGTDVARKVVILAREAGLKLSLEDIPIESLVPVELQDPNLSVDEFMRKLPEFDQSLTARREDAEAKGQVLRFVGVVDVLNNRGSVELRKISKSDAFAQLSGSDNIIAFKTARYQENRLIVRGPGAGAEVTAGGVFSDLLRLSSYLGAPS